MPTSPPPPLIVIIENDQHLADALALLVDDWGYVAVAASSASRVAQALGPRIEDVRAIITDYQLDDGFTGLKAASVIAKAIGHAVPTIITTAHTELAEREDVFPVLYKPFDPSVLHHWLDNEVSGPAPPSRSSQKGPVHATPARCGF